jgi:hypothetical protein
VEFTFTELVSVEETDVNEGRVKWKLFDEDEILNLNYMVYITLLYVFF